MLPVCGLKNGKYSAAVASASWLTDAAYSLRVHTVFPHFPNLVWNQNLSPSALADLIRASLGNFLNDISLKSSLAIFQRLPNREAFFFYTKNMLMKETISRASIILRALFVPVSLVIWFSSKEILSKKGVSFHKRNASCRFPDESMPHKDKCPPQMKFLLKSLAKCANMVQS